ncbi:NADPH:quinone oxidoreductase family protein [Indiicoccus explosivorum]|uniref:NADPH:quinone oxidoreductase family protein n=1 Tax=Indiicoccus explosivorum TaxID=1917864 RepID=UPI0030C66DB6
MAKLGEPREALELSEVPKPEPGTNEVLVRVEAAALNFFDILQCQGKYQEEPPLPFTPGAEVAGTIEMAGQRVDVNIGQRVIATPMLPNGGLAEWVVVPQDHVFPIPDAFPAAEAGSLFITYQTAYFALHRTAKLKKAEVLLIHAGSGGVGSAAIQVGKAMGATVIATAGSDEKLAVCKQLGADIAVNYRESDFVAIVKEATNGKGADVIFDPVGGDTFDRSRKCIAFEGRLLVIGFAGGRIAEAPTNHALIKNYSIMGVHFGLFRNLYPEKVMAAHRELMDFYEQGLIRPLVFKEYPFEQVPDALEQLGSRRTYGKLVVIP